MRFKLLTCLLLLAAFLAAGAAAQSTDAQLVVTGYTLDPTSLIRGDTGTLSVTVKNTGTDAVSIHSADLESPCEGIRILNTAAYDTVGTLGSGDSMMFTFTFQANVADGTYYPKFYLDLTDGGSYRMYIPVNVKSTDLTVAVSKLPDSFNEGVKTEINISVGNPRENEVNGVRIIPLANGATVTPGTGFVGTLAVDASKEVTFAITPSKETTVTFMVAYHNGINDHIQNITLPVRFTKDKLGAEVVLNNVEIESGSTNTIAGDINNAGLTSAYSVTVTVGSPATAVDPNKIYVIGELEPDDFASFEVTYTGSGSTVPVVVSYKDADGNTFTKMFEASTRAGGGTSPASGSASSGSSSGYNGAPGGSRGGGMSLFGMRGINSGNAGSSIPFLQIGIGLVLVLVIVIVAWKKGYLRKLKEKIPRRKQGEDEDESTDR